ncbi:MAG: LPS export ABC transporter ATP-binding protein [Deltaproteobacteria bacterium]|nr:LPS export ABC transporter ATP-binding protein [Deltaproteobacteria bacterium]OQY16605.1 MAG: LPS export ABC transporter ATP-binding protein [Desulfobacterium sp. 4572_20]HDH88440.1 LPS export ABC transporter ATP-binding protein [Desulfobacteraceae bacterium]MBW2105872.1 LPS export ABC transporter ATP-binding protein [Deltaproteobacteria bacterium]MCD6264771.1 LPS export ABC transporter ATP-binding protein [Deltaproteobacteria bacterium]
MKEENSRGSLNVKDLVKSYGKRVVVKRVNLAVNRGQIIGLLGPNGAGKTTTFYMIVGLIRAKEGQIFLDGKDITHEPMYLRARQGINYLSQEPSVFRKLTVEENLLAIMEVIDIPVQERQSFLQSLLAELKIGHLAKQKAYSLSGGERRRLEITRAMITQPKFILLDEPFAGIDPMAINDIKQIVKGLKEKNLGILISDHNVRETLDVCDLAYIINDGEIIESGVPEKIAASEVVRSVYLGEDFNL